MSWFKALVLFLLTFSMAASAVEVNGQLKNAQLEKLSTDPSGNVVEARTYYNTTSKFEKYYNGTAWKSVAENPGTTQGDIPYCSTTASPCVMTRLGIGSSTQVLHGGSTTPGYSAVALAADVSGTLPVANGGTGIASFGAGVADWLGTPSSANLATAITDETGSGLAVFATSPSLTTPSLGVATATSINGTSIPSSKTLVVTTDNLSSLASTTSLQLKTLLSDETGSGASVFGTSPTISGGTLSGIDTFSLNDTGSAFNLVLASTDVPAMTADRTLTLDLSNADRTISLGGNFTTAGGFATTLTTSGSTNVTLPTTGTLVAQAFQADLTNKTLEDGSVFFRNSSVSTKKGAFDLSGVSSATTRTLTWPNFDGTIATLAGTESFTNKTLTSPKLNENVAVTTTATQLNYLAAATGTTGTTSTNLVYSTSPTLVTPAIGVATATSVNGTTIPSSKTLVVTTDTLAVHASTTSSQLAGVLSDETGTGLAMFATSPSITTSLKFNGTSSGTLTMAPGATITDYTITWPSAQGAASTVLTNDGSGGLSWGAALTTSLTSQNTFIGNGSNVATATNTSLLGYITASTASQTYAVTSAAPGVFTISSHGLLTGDKAYVTVTQNGFTANTTYYVHKIDANTFHLSTTLANATGATYITSSGTTAGTIVSGGFNLTAGVRGTVTNDSATAGYVGEVIRSRVAGPTSFGASATVQDLTTITLTAGMWLVTGMVQFQANGATFSSVDLESWFGTAATTSTTGQRAGDNDYHTTGIPVTFGASEMVMGPLVVRSDGTDYQIGVDGTTATSTQVLRLKGVVGAYTGASAQFNCYLQAVRVR